MTWFESAAAGLMAAVVGVISAAIVAFAAFQWFPFTGLEGAVGTFIALNAVLGGLFAFLIGLLAARGWNRWAKPEWRPFTSPAHVGGASGALVVVIASLTALTLWLLADIPPEISGHKLNLEVEIRMTANETTPPAELGEPQFKLYSVIDRVRRNEIAGQLKIKEARQDDTDRWVVPASVLVFTTRGQRLVEAQLGGETIASFTVPLQTRPGPEDQKWSVWLPKAPPPPKPGKNVMPVAKGGFDKNAKTPPPPPPTPPPAGTATGTPAASATAEGTNYRYRVVLIGRAPSTPVVAKNAVAPTKILAKAEPTLPELLANTRISASDAERDAALAAITSKPDHVDALSALMMSEDNRVAADAMYLVSKLPQTRTALAPGVMKAGLDIATRLDKLNELQGDAASQSAGASDITIRFAAWMDAVRVLRRGSGLDFIPQLVAILERSRVRTDNAMVQRDVRRVASRFAKEWGGVAPQAGDPPW